MSQRRHCELASEVLIKSLNSAFTAMGTGAGLLWSVTFIRVAMATQMPILICLRQNLKGIFPKKYLNVTHEEETTVKMLLNDGIFLFQTKPKLFLESFPDRMRMIRRYAHCYAWKKPLSIPSVIPSQSPLRSLCHFPDLYEKQRAGECW